MAEEAGEEGDGQARTLLLQPGQLEAHAQLLGMHHRLDDVAARQVALREGPRPMVEAGHGRATVGHRLEALLGPRLQLVEGVVAHDGERHDVRAVVLVVPLRQPARDVRHVERGVVAAAVLVVGERLRGKRAEHLVLPVAVALQVLVVLGVHGEHLARDLALVKGWRDEELRKPVHRLLKRGGLHAKEVVRVR